MYWGAREHKYPVVVAQATQMLLIWIGRKKGYQADNRD